MSNFVEKTIFHDQADFVCRLNAWMIVFVYPIRGRLDVSQSFGFGNRCYLGFDDRVLLRAHGLWHLLRQL